MAQFMPNMCNGPCIYCNETSVEYSPEEYLRCDLCRRIAHLVCLKPRNVVNRLIGDNFFTLTCRHCSHEDYDKIIRVDMKFLHVLLLVMYNLHKNPEYKSVDGYFHWERHVWAFLVKKWKYISSSDSQRSFNKMKKNSITSQLSQNFQYFQKNPDVKRCGAYRLTVVLSPAQLLNKVIQDKHRMPAEYSLAPCGKLKPFTENNPNTSNPETAEINDSRSLIEESNTDNNSLVSFDTASSYESIDDSSRGSWFTETYLRPDSLLPESIFDDEDDEEVKETKIKTEEIVIEEEIYDEDIKETKVNTEEMKVDEEIDVGNEQQPLSLKVSLFKQKPKIKVELSDSENEEISSKKQCVEPMTIYEERQLLSKLNKGYENNNYLPPGLYRLRRKLKLRTQQREHSVPVLDIDTETEFLGCYGRPMTRKEKLDHQTIQIAQNSFDSTTRVLDRFQIGTKKRDYIQTDFNTSFRAKLVGSLEETPSSIYSPYTLRTLKPFIFRDFETFPPKLKLLREIVAHHNMKNLISTEPKNHPIDYCYVTPKHIPAINTLARTFFWSGIELSETLQYPDYTCVVQYKGLVIGFGVIVPDVKHDEAYISFLLVHPEWQRAGIGKFILYHLIQTCMGKDITLHVSTSNSAVILYQKFGFKVEEFIKDFYDKYLPLDSTECKHAMCMRMNR